MRDIVPSSVTSQLELSPLLHGTSESLLRVMWCDVDVTLKDFLYIDAMRRIQKSWCFLMRKHLKTCGKLVIVNLHVCLCNTLCSLVMYTGWMMVHALLDTSKTESTYSTSLCEHVWASSHIPYELTFPHTPSKSWTQNNPVVYFVKLH